MDIIEIIDLHKTYSSESQIINAVNGINLTVKKNSIFGFLGPNGAGKTTTLRILTTLLIPDKGTVLINGYDIIKNQIRVRESIGYVGQRNGAQGCLSPRENLIFQARLYGINKKEATHKADQLIEKFDLISCCHRRISNLSGGQVRRVDLAMGLIHEPTLIFLDEPTTGLDPQSRAYLWAELVKLRDQGLTIFMTTHYLDEADSLCDQVAIIDHGNIVAHGDLLDLKRQISGETLTLDINEHPQLELVIAALKNHHFVKEVQTPSPYSLRISLIPGTNSFGELFSSLSPFKVSIKTMNLASASLNEVFLAKTGRELRQENN